MHASQHVSCIGVFRLCAVSTRVWRVETRNSEIMEKYSTIIRIERTHSLKNFRTVTVVVSKMDKFNGQNWTNNTIWWSET